MELSAALNMQLIDQFLRHSDAQVPIADWQSFRSKFADAGQRLEALTPSQAMFGRCIIALGARITDSPLVIGSQAPTHGMLPFMDDAELLSNWGMARCEPVRRLALEAARAADQAMVWQQQSHEACA